MIMRYLLNILILILVFSMPVSAQIGAGKSSFDANYKAAFRDYYSGNFDSAYHRTQMMIEEAKSKDDPRYLAASYTFATLFSDHKGHVAEDLDNLYKALSIYKDLGDSARISAVYRYIGEALGDLQMYQNAYDFFYRAIKIAGDCDDVYEESRGYNSLFEYTMVDLETEVDSAGISGQLRNIISKMEYFSHVVADDTLEHIHRQNVARIYINLASAYILKARYENNIAYADSAQKYIEKIRKAMGFQRITLMRSYIMESSVLLAKNKPSDAFYRLKEIEKLTANLPLTNTDFAKLYHNLSVASQRLGNLEEAIDYKEKALEYQSLTVNEYNISVGFEYQTKLMADNEISAHQRDKELVEFANNEKLRNVRFIGYWAFGILLVLVAALSVLGLVLRRNKKATRKLNILFNKLEKHNRKLVDQQNELTEQNDLIQKQRDTVDKINKEIMSSITYAQRIQKAAYSQDNDIKQLFSDSFRMIRSDSLVTGCFHITHEYKSIKILVAATCSRNGVPGSFFAMLGLSSLREVLVKYRPEGEFSPAELLSSTDFNLRQLLSNSRNDDIVETIDMSILAFDVENRMLSYSGANQGIYFCHESDIKYLAGNAHRLGDPNNSEFVTEKTPIAPGDMVYVFNNSVEKQVNIYDMTFDTYHVKQMIKRVSALPCDQQKEEINNTMTNWLGTNNQTGDIGIIGIRCVFW